LLSCWDNAHTTWRVNNTRTTHIRCKETVNKRATSTWLSLCEWTKQSKQPRTETRCEYLLVVVVEDGDDDVVVQTDKSWLVEPGFSSCLHLFSIPRQNPVQWSIFQPPFKERTTKFGMIPTYWLYSASPRNTHVNIQHPPDEGMNDWSTRPFLR